CGRPASCPHERATVGHERVAGEVAAGVRAEEPRERPDVELGVALAAHRAVVHEDPVALALLCGVAVVVGRRRGDPVHAGARRRPAVRVGARTASLAALYAGRPVPPVIPIDDAKFTLRPQPCSRMCGYTACIAQSVPLTPES